VRERGYFKGSIFLHFFLLSVEASFPLIRSDEGMLIPLQGQMPLPAMSQNILKGR
jgi:ABC-type microcin C transport system permease subunit YejE